MDRPRRKSAAFSSSPLSSLESSPASSPSAKRKRNNAVKKQPPKPTSIKGDSHQSHEIVSVAPGLPSQSSSTSLKGKSKSSKSIPRTEFHRRQTAKSRSTAVDDLPPFPSFELPPFKRRKRVSVADDALDELKPPPPLDKDKVLRDYFGDSAASCSSLMTMETSSSPPLTPPPPECPLPTVKNGKQRIGLHGDARNHEDGPSSPSPKTRSYPSHRAVLSSSPLSSPPPSLPPSSPDCIRITSQITADAVEEELEKEDSEDDEDGDEDDLPDIQDILAGALASPKPATRIKKNDKKSDDEERKPTTRPIFRPTILKSEMEIGTPCLVLSKGVYIPAVLTGFAPAQSEEERRIRGDRFEVLNCFGKSRNDLKRSGKTKQVLFKDDPEFPSCTLAKIVLYGETFQSDAMTRALTPELEVPSVHFSDLELEEQIRLIRPHLQTIIEETYPPAQWRTDLFHGGDRARLLLDRQLQFGGRSDDDVEAWEIPELERWALRGDRWNEHSHKRAEEPPRPRGSERYEALNTIQKRKYIRDVLLPETIIQICIQTHDLTSESPAELYTQARAKLDELANKDERNTWDIRERTLKTWRIQRRKEEGLPEERLSHEDKERKDREGKYESWTRRWKRKADYRN